MRKPPTLLLATIFVCTVAYSAAGQQASAPEAAKPSDPTHFYRLDFVVKESDQGKVLNQRAYSLGVAAAGTVERRAPLSGGASALARSAGQQRCRSTTATPMLALTPMSAPTTWATELSS